MTGDRRSEPQRVDSSGWSSPGGWLAVLGIFVVSFVIGLWWLHHFRAGFPLDIDESRYIAFGLALHDGLAAGAWRDTSHLWTGQQDFAPLLPLTSTPAFGLFGRTLMVALATQFVFLGVLLAGSYGLGSRLTDVRGGVLVTAVVAGTPGIIDFSRSFQFPVTVAAMLTAATFALLASERLDRRGWAIAWGVLLGGTVLTRTMTVAFLPAQLVLAAWLAVESRPDRRRRLLSLALGLLAGLITAATWYGWSWRSVAHYLTGFGYGESSARFGASGSRFSVDYWSRELGNLVKVELYLPLAILLLVALALGVVAVVARRRGHTESLTAMLRRWSTTDVIVVAVIVAEAYVAVSSSKNEGVGFRLPIIPLVVALAVWCLWQLRWRCVRLALGAGLVAVAALNFIMKADVTSTVSRTTIVDVPTIGKTPVLNGTGYIQGYVYGSFEVSPRPAVDRFPPSEKGWLRSYDKLVSTLTGPRGHLNPDTVVGLSTFEPLMNPNNLSLADRLRFRQSLRVRLLVAPAGRQTQLGLARAVLAPPAAAELVTVDRVGLSYSALTGQAAIKQPLLKRVLRRLHYRRVATVRLPDKRLASVWRQPAR
jgi:hypothetical protein